MKKFLETIPDHPSQKSGQNESQRYCFMKLTRCDDQLVKQKFI